MRGTPGGLATPHPIGSYLPALYQEDDLTQRLLAGLDEVLAPVFATLDALPAYLDPGTAPEDFLAWVGSWLGLVLDPEWSPQRRRAVVAEASRLYGLRGTAAGLRELLALVSDADIEVSDSGGVAVSELPGGELPGTPEPTVTVRLHGLKQDAVDALLPLIRAWRPAHVLVSLQLDAQVEL